MDIKAIEKQNNSCHLEELNRVFGVGDDSLVGHQIQFLAIREQDSETAKAMLKMGIDENFEEIRQQIN